MLLQLKKLYHIVKNIDKMTGEQVREYIENELGCEPVHEVDALACAIEDMANELEEKRDGKYTKFYVPYWAYLKEDIFKGRKIWSIRSNPKTDNLTSFFIYYLAHEISHVLNSPKVKSHGNRFYKIFTRVCPVELQHYELTYKTKTASKYIKEAA